MYSVRQVWMVNVPYVEFTYGVNVKHLTRIENVLDVWNFRTYTSSQNCIRRPTRLVSSKRLGRTHTRDRYNIKRSYWLYVELRAMCILILMAIINGKCLTYMRWMSFYNSVKGDNLEILYLPLEDRIFFKGSLMMVWENGRCSKTENIFYCRRFYCIHETYKVV